MNTERLDGKVFVITGGSSGMGAALAKDFCNRGAKAAIFDLDEAKGTEVVEEIRASGGSAEFFSVRCDK